MNPTETSGVDPTMDQAFAALEAAEKRLEAPAEPSKESASESQIAPVDPPEDGGTPPEPKPGETPGAPATTETTTEPAKPAEAKRDESGKFAKDHSRRVGSWKELNTDKETFRGDQAKFKVEREAFDRERLAFEKKQADAAASNIRTPEHYEKSAADNEAWAEAAEKRGDFDTADELRALAKLSKRMAVQVRANPPKPDPSAEETKKAFDEDQKKWMAKAGIDFPEIAKKGPNGEDSASLARYKGFTTQGSDVYDPIIHEAVRNTSWGPYYASRMAHAETVAASVPTLTKDLADSRAEVKRLNGKLSPNGGGLPNGQPAKPEFRNLTLAQQEEQLRADAAAIGRGR